MERKVGTISRGIRCPIIREGDNLADIIVSSVLEAAQSEGYELRDRDIIAATESIVARAQGNYASIDAVAKDVKEKKQEYEKVEDAMSSVNARGYGVVAPALSDIVMEEPELITHAGKYGVKIRATSPSIHMIRANIETEIAPIVGNKEQAEDLITYIKDGEYSEDGVWSTNIFGKSLGDMMEDGIRDKISKMDDECQTQLQNTMQKIVNDNNGGLVCIII